MESNNYFTKKIIVRNYDEVAPAIFVYDNIIDNSEELINIALSNDDGWDSARIVNGKVDRDTRNNRVLPIPATYSNSIKWFEVAQIIWHHANDYGINNDVQFSNMEYALMLHYYANRGFYKPHIDSGPGMDRVFSAVLYLNEVEHGGETYFNKFNISIKPKPGRLVIFPANFAYIHEAKPPISNDKFVIVTWFNPVTQ